MNTFMVYYRGTTGEVFKRVVTAESSSSAAAKVAAEGVQVVKVEGLRTQVDGGRRGSRLGSGGAEGGIAAFFTFHRLITPTLVRVTFVVLTVVAAAALVAGPILYAVEVRSVHRLAERHTAEAERIAKVEADLRSERAKASELRKELAENTDHEGRALKDRGMRAGELRQQLAQSEESVRTRVADAGVPK